MNITINLLILTTAIMWKESWFWFKSRDNVTDDPVACVVFKLYFRQTKCTGVEHLTGLLDVFFQTCAVFKRETQSRHGWTLSNTSSTSCSWRFIRSAQYQTLKSPEALYEMSVKYQEHQFPLTIILPQSCMSHLSGDEVQHTERGAAGEQILQRSVSTPEKRHCRAETSPTDQPQPESLGFTWTIRWRQSRLSSGGNTSETLIVDNQFSFTPFIYLE